ncbi:uncharacterized protein LOC144020110 isoform X2 [Festucalex cinctus]
MPNKSESMSRRKAAKGKTSGGLVDVLSTEDMTKEQLEEQLVRLREELEREREERSFFQLERDEIRSWWEVSRRRLDQTRAQLGRQKDEAERRHLVEINVYKQKLKHVLSEQAAAAAHVKTDGGEVAWLERRRHADDETRRRRRTQDRQADARRRKFSQRKCVQELKLKHQVELMELSNKYDKRVAELESKYFEKTERMRRAESDKTSAAILSLEETMRRRLRSLTDAQRRTFPRAQQFFGDAQSKLARDGKTLKEEASAARTQHARTSVSLEGAQRDNARLFVGLQGAQQNLPDLRRKLEAHERARRQQAVSVGGRRPSVRPFVCHVACGWWACPAGRRRPRQASAGAAGRRHPGARRARGRLSAGGGGARRAAVQADGGSVVGPAEEPSEGNAAGAQDGAPERVRGQDGGADPGRARRRRRVRRQTAGNARVQSGRHQDATRRSAATVSGVRRPGGLVWPRPGRARRPLVRVPARSRRARPGPASALTCRHNFYFTHQQEVEGKKMGHSCSTNKKEKSIKMCCLDLLCANRKTC